MFFPLHVRCYESYFEGRWVPTPSKVPTTPPTDWLQWKKNPGVRSFDGCLFVPLRLENLPSPRHRTPILSPTLPCCPLLDQASLDHKLMKLETGLRAEDCEVGCRSSRNESPGVGWAGAEQDARPGGRKSSGGVRGEESKERLSGRTVSIPGPQLERCNQGRMSSRRGGASAAPSFSPWNCTPGSDSGVAATSRTTPGPAAIQPRPSAVRT